MSYSFRLRFVLPEQLRLNSDETVVKLSDDSAQHTIELRSIERDKTIKQARQLSVVGTDYASEGAAQADGEKWRSAIELGFALNGVGADFGNRGPKSFIYHSGLRLLEEKTGKRVLNDTHGLMVFETEPAPIVFSAGNVTAVGHKRSEDVVSAISKAYCSGVKSDTKERLAYELYAASFFQQSADARFLTLMMAVETLIEREPREEKMIAHIEKLVADTKASSLGKEEKHSLGKSLDDLKLQSIGQAGRKLAARLSSRKYNDTSAQAFFGECYSLRSKLIHGNSPLPAWKDVNSMSGQLEKFVGDLISLKMKD